MVAFRRCFFALAVVILLSSLASAQTSSTPFTCQAAVSVPPTLRSEGLTEQIGDIVLTCTGGNNGQYTLGAPLPTANISVSLGTNVTSRIISGSVSEALLMIDEPGSALTPVVAGEGPAAPQTFCSSASAGAGAGGCAQYPILATPILGGTPVAVMSSSPTILTNPANIYQGEWFSYAPNQIQFFGIPILPAVSSGIARIYRITNIRANVSGFSGAALQGTQQLNASVSISSNTSVTLSTPFQTAGFIQTSLSTSLRSVNNTGFSSSSATYPQCNGLSSPTAVGLLQYQENFGTAFKVRNNPAGPGGPQGGGLSQNIPGTIYNSESGFEASSPNGTVGLADFGTRLQAAFHGIPSGVRMFVSLNNVTNTSNISVTNAATLVATGPYPASGVLDTSSGFAGVPILSATTTIGSSPAIPMVEIIPDSTGSAYAVWESTVNNPAAIDTYDFVYAILYSVTGGITSPPIPSGSSSVAATVNMSYAPVPPVGSSATTLTAWGTAAPTSAPLNIPRFADTSGSGITPAYTINICETVLLFPFVTNQSGFDTGLAISNTTTDPLGTTAQQGVCNLSAYGNNAPTSQPACTTASTTGFCMPGTTSTGAAAASGFVISTGTTSATLASLIAPNFQGYIVAVCQFQLAHGFAFVTDVGARNLAMGYLALVTGTPTNNGVGSKRNNINESIAH
jgi:hypothetical protein